MHQRGLPGSAPLTLVCRPYRALEVTNVIPGPSKRAWWKTTAWRLLLWWNGTFKERTRKCTCGKRNFAVIGAPKAKFRCNQALNRYDRCGCTTLLSAQKFGVCWGQGREQ